MAISDLLNRYGIASEGSRLRGYMDKAPNMGQLAFAVEEMAETIGTTVGWGAVEQRYGEKKTSIGMKDDPNGKIDPDDPEGKKIDKVPGTGLSYAALTGLVTLGIAALAPMTPSWRARFIRVSTGSFCAVGYRKGLGLGQKWLDSAQPEGAKPPDQVLQPPYARSDQSASEISSVKGEETAKSGSFAELIARADKISADDQRERLRTGTRG